MVVVSPLSSASREVRKSLVITSGTSSSTESWSWDRARTSPAKESKLYNELRPLLVTEHAPFPSGEEGISSRAEGGRWDEIVSYALEHRVAGLIAQVIISNEVVLSHASADLYVQPTGSGPTIVPDWPDHCASRCRGQEAG
jgi:hypothetical protein